MADLSAGGDRELPKQGIYSEDFYPGLRQEWEGCLCRTSVEEYGLESDCLSSDIRFLFKIFLLEMIIYLGLCLLSEVQVCEIPATTKKFSQADGYIHVSPIIWQWGVEEAVSKSPN